MFKQLRFRPKFCFSSHATRRFASRSAVVDNPYTGETYCEIPYISKPDVDNLAQKASKAQKAWRNTSLNHRIDIVKKAMGNLKQASDQMARDITCMMGKPLQQALNETKTLQDRGAVMTELAPAALTDQVISSSEEKGLRKIVREPVGVVLVIAPWNYPLLTAVNAIVPAVLAGNAVLIKHSSRTPKCADHFEAAFRAAGVPDGLVSACHADHSGIEYLLGRPEVGYCHFTGSVSAGHQIYGWAARRFIDVGLELGGKDPAYVAQDAAIDHAADSLVDGSCYNSGQSCCGIERLYVHTKVYDQFIEKALKHFKAYKLGNPLNSDVTLGPLASSSAIPFLKAQVDEAVKKGGKVLTGGSPTHDSTGKGRFFQPTLVVDCNHSMTLMTEESFGPVLGVQRVSSDEEALKLMNDSQYGLTCAVYTADQGRAEKFARELETGTVYMNRCDYLDPRLAWTGVKDTGKGVSLSSFGFGPLTRLKSYNFRVL